jgi:inorganic triphosphatase YgiF
LARVIANFVPARLELKSKSEYGYDLTADQPAVAAGAKTISSDATRARRMHFVSSDAPSWHTWRRTNRGAGASDSEAAHQMRVGLRRLRAAMSVFKELLGDKQSERIKGEVNGSRASSGRHAISTSI